MKKMPALILIILFVPLFSYAFQNEPDNFRGIKWGTNIKDLPDMVQLDDPGRQNNNIKHTQRNNEILQIGDAELSDITYRFYKDQFCFVSIRFESKNFRKLKETLFKLYGPGFQNNPFIENYSWHGANIDIDLYVEGGLIGYCYKPLLKAEINDGKDNAKRRSGDL